MDENRDQEPTNPYDGSVPGENEPRTPDLTPPNIPEPEGLPEPPRTPDFETPPTPPPPPGSPQFMPQQPPQYRPAEKSKIVAGVLGLLLGEFGIHKFYLGYVREGVIMLVVSVLGSVLTFGLAGGVVWAIGFVEGILYLTKSDAEFDAIYVRGRRPWL